MVMTSTTGGESRTKWRAHAVRRISRMSEARLNCTAHLYRCSHVRVQKGTGVAPARDKQTDHQLIRQSGARHKQSSYRWMDIPDTSNVTQPSSDASGDIFHPGVRRISPKGRAQANDLACRSQSQVQMHNPRSSGLLSDILAAGCNTTCTHSLFRCTQLAETAQ